MVHAANAAIVWESGSYFGPISTEAFYWDIYVIHNSDTDDDYFSSHGIHANIGYPEDTWNGFASASEPVTDQNINAALGNWTYASLVDGIYWMDAYMKANGQDYGSAFQPRAMCDQGEGDCSYF